ncbi:hypothetical protein C8F04DRAFT_1273125 [Mycena alexandri]|uniref:Uncharacterized protein n=1 Tax=Mycena alexandri TaxID=1745969 RepID=A0AAD6WUV4_9AGAR|nr:hypothetical protein C8F04DRAFT_1273125 [Mycena alexandri]
MQRRSQTTRPVRGAAASGKAKTTAKSNAPAKNKQGRGKKRGPAKKKAATPEVDQQQDDTEQDGAETEDGDQNPDESREEEDNDSIPPPHADEDEDFDKIFPPRGDKDEEPREEEDFDKIFARREPPPKDLSPPPPNDTPPPPPNDFTATPPPNDFTVTPPPNDMPPPPQRLTPAAQRLTPAAQRLAAPAAQRLAAPAAQRLAAPRRPTTCRPRRPATRRPTTRPRPSPQTEAYPPPRTEAYPPTPNGGVPPTPNGGVPPTPDGGVPPTTKATAVTPEDQNPQNNRNEIPTPRNTLVENFRPRPDQSEAEKNAAELKRAVNGDLKGQYEAAIAEFESSMQETANKLAKQFDKTPQEVRKALRGKTSLVKERAHNLQNAKVWKFAQSENADRPVGSKLKAPALQKLLKERGLFEDLTPVEEDELLREFEESRGLKKSGTRLNNAAAARDVTAFTKFVNRELALLNKRTGAIAFCCIGRSDVNDTLNPACVGTEDALKFFPQILQTTDEQFAVKFDNYGVNRDAVGLAGSFDFLRKDTVARISDGLFRATGKHVHMKYGDYDDLLTDYGVELVGWPEGVPFQAPSVLGSIDRIRPVHDALVAGSCRWEKMSEGRVAEHKELVSKKLKKGKKDRSDKGLTREEAKEQREQKEQQSKGKRKRADGDLTPLRLNRKDMDPEELADHLRRLNREKKRRARARAAGKPVPAPSRSTKSGPPPKKKTKSREVVSDSSGDDSDSDREEEEEWVPVGEKAKKNARGKKRKAAEESESEEDSEGEGGKKKAGGKKKKSKATHREGSDSDSDSDAPPKAPLPFSAKHSKKYLLAMQLTAENTRRIKRRERQKAAIRSSNSPQKSPAKRPVPKPAYKGKEGTSDGGGAGTGGAQGGTGPSARAAPTLTPGASSSRSNLPDNGNRPNITPGASTSQLPKVLGLTDIAAYATEDSSDED